MILTKEHITVANVSAHIVKVHVKVITFHLRLEGDTPHIRSPKYNGVI